MNSFLEKKNDSPKNGEKEGRIDKERQKEKPAEIFSLALPNLPPTCPPPNPRPCLGHPVGPRE